LINFAFTTGAVDAIDPPSDRRFVAVQPKPTFGVKLRMAPYGQEKLCTRCVEWWPADLEFFYADPDGAAGLFYCCKACYQEWKAENLAKRKARKAEGAV
jgi:hypothetical protein